MHVWRSRFENEECFFESLNPSLNEEEKKAILASEVISEKSRKDRIEFFNKAIKAAVKKLCMELQKKGSELNYDIAMSSKK